MNIFESGVTTKYVVVDDLTGEERDVSQRVDILRAVEVIQEVHAKLLYGKPSVEKYETTMAMRELCRHFGWSPVDVALIEHYQMESAVANASK